MFVSILPLFGLSATILILPKFSAIDQPPSMACIGECMVELGELPGGLLQRGWGSDTLNTAVYLARPGTPVNDITTLGGDA